MIKLFVLILSLHNADASQKLQHNDTFPTIAACEKAWEDSKASLVQAIEQQVQIVHEKDFTLQHACEVDGRDASRV
jgi:aspartyl/asparaginyl beta-hydroxylase (cupin superfamily)